MWISGLKGLNAFMLLLYLRKVAFCFAFQVFSMTSHYMIVSSIFRPLLPPLMEQLCPPNRLNFFIAVKRYLLGVGWDDLILLFLRSI